MILPPVAVNGRVMAHCAKRPLYRLSDSTPARIADPSVAGEYPRSAAVYKLRTPSPGGQYGAKRHVLSAFFAPGERCHNPVLREPEQRSGVYLSEREIKGAQSCPSEHSFFPSRPACRSRPAARPSVTRPSAVALSVQVRPLSPAAARFRAQPSAQRATLPIASSIPANVTDTSARLRPESDRPRVVTMRGFRVSACRAQANFSAQSKRDI